MATIIQPGTIAATSSVGTPILLVAPFCASNRMECRLGTNQRTCVTWKLFYANCPRGNLLCNSRSVAYVSATTVCSQRLF